MGTLCLIYYSVLVLDVLIQGGCYASQCRETLTYHVAHTTILEPGQRQWNPADSLLDIHTLGLCAYYTSHDERYRGFVFDNLAKLCTPVFGLVPSGTTGATDADGADEILYLDVKLDCDDNFQLYGVDEEVSCLLPSSLEKTFDEATSFCNDFGGHLVEIKTVAKLDLIKSLLPGQNVWTGLDDRGTENVFLFQSDGSQLTTEQKDNLFDPASLTSLIEDCVHIWNEPNLLNDGQCSSKYNFVCEIYILK